MKKIILFLTAAILFAACEDNSGPKDSDYSRKNLKKPTELVEKMSYTFGFDIGQGVDLLDSGNRRVSFDYMIEGILDGLNQNEALLDNEERMLLMREIQNIQTENDKKRYNEKMKEISKIGDKFKEMAPKFLEDNLKKEGWKETNTGLQYKVIKEVEGPTPAENLVVAADIRGELMNGEVFENTFEEGGEPINMPLEGLAYGIREAVMMLSVGDIYEFVIPAEIAFTDIGSGSRIPPHSVLIMKIEMIEFVSTVDEYRKNMSKPPGL